MLTLAGIKQTLPRRRSVRSATTLPLVTMALSFYGVASVFPVSRWRLSPGLFFLKFGVGVAVAINPARVSEVAFAGLVGLVYGAFSGIFLARGVRTAACSSTEARSHGFGGN